MNEIRVLAVIVGLLAASDCSAPPLPSTRTSSSARVLEESPAISVLQGRTPAGHDDRDDSGGLQLRFDPPLESMAGVIEEPTAVLLCRASDCASLGQELPLLAPRFWAIREGHIFVAGSELDSSGAEQRKIIDFFSSAGHERSARCEVPWLPVLAPTWIGAGMVLLLRSSVSDLTDVLVVSESCTFVVSRSVAAATHLDEADQFLISFPTSESGRGVLGVDAIDLLSGRVQNILRPGTVMEVKGISERQGGSVEVEYVAPSGQETRTVVRLSR